MIDPKAFEALQCGMHIISTTDGQTSAGCIVNTVMQATATPLQVIVTVNKENHTAKMMQQTEKFCAAALEETASMDLISTFGFRTSTEYDKFERFPVEKDAQGIPYVNKSVVAIFSCEIVGMADVGTHLIFIGKVVDAQRISQGHAMTYAYYHMIKKGSTPPKASSYVPPTVGRGYRCKVCGHVLEGAQVPEGFVCPVCGQGKEAMESL